MAVKVYELFHGVVLTKLLRSERPVSLKLVEINSEEHWSTYILNDAVRLFIAYCAVPKIIKRPDPGKSWQFTFSQNQLKQIENNEESKPVYAALVCGGNNILESEDMHVCLLEPEELARVVNCGGATQSLVIKCSAGKRLRVIKDRKEELLVPRNRIDSMEVPGG